MSGFVGHMGNRRPLTSLLPASAAFAASVPNGRAQTELRNQISGVSVAEPGNRRVWPLRQQPER